MRTGQLSAHTVRPIRASFSHRREEQHDLIWRKIPIWLILSLGQLVLRFIYVQHGRIEN